jgi:hypothetical protein
MNASCWLITRRATMAFASARWQARFRSPDRVFLPMFSNSGDTACRPSGRRSTQELVTLWSFSLALVIGGGAPARASTSSCENAPPTRVRRYSKSRDAPSGTVPCSFW